MTFLGRDIRLTVRDSGVLAQLWLLPVLVLFVAGLFVPSTALTASVITLITLLIVLMVTLPLAARIWHDDLYSGVAEQVVLSPRGLIGLVVARWITLYVLAYVPVTFITLGGTFLWLAQPMTAANVVATLLLAASTLALAMVVAALTASLRNGGLLVALLLIPFLLPIFIAYAAVSSVPAALYLLAAAAVLAVPLCCLAVSRILRQQLCV